MPQIHVQCPYSDCRQVGKTARYFTEAATVRYSCPGCERVIALVITEGHIAQAALLPSMTDPDPSPKDPWP